MVVGVPAVGRSGVDLSELDTADRVAELRRRLAAMPGGGLSAAARSGIPVDTAAVPQTVPAAVPAVIPASGGSDGRPSAVVSAGESPAERSPEGLPPEALSPDALSPRALSVDVPSPEALSEADGARSVLSGPGSAPSVPGVQVPGVPVPESVAGLLPGGVLPAGKVTAVAGSATLRVGLLAAATAAGVRCAVVGWPELGVAAVAEQGGRLDCLALVPNPGPDPAAVVSVLIDGLDLVLLGPDVAGVAPSRARVLAGRVRSAGAVLLVGPGWPGTELTLAGRHCRYGGLGAGAGRLVSVSTLVRCSGRAAPPRTAEWVAAG